MVRFAVHGTGGAFLMAGAEMYRMGLEEAGAMADIGDVAVMDALTTRLLPAVTVGKDVEFRTDVAPGEKRRYLLIPRSCLAPSVKGKLANSAGQLKVGLSR